MNIVRPKTFLTYIIPTFDGKSKVVLKCFPQQKWETVGVSYDKGGIELHRNNVWLIIPKSDFENNWKVVE